MDDVTVHYGSPRPAALGALAYASGSEIFLGPGQERHLPHEAWHVAQQSRGRIEPTMYSRGSAINADERLEREADVMGARATRTALDGHSAVQRSQHERPAPPRVSAHTPPLDIERLQSTAGNLAVARLLERPRPRVTFAAAVTTPPAAAGAAVLQRVMANVRFALDGPPVVKTVSIERGSGTGGGAHATAFVVFQDTAINATLGFGFPTAVTNLLALCDNVANLPGYKEPAKVLGGVAAKTKSDKKLTEIKNNVEYKNLDAKDRADWAPILQALIVDYLLLRNAVPGTYVPAAVKPSGMKGVGEKQEKAGAERMWAMRDTFAKAIDATPDATPKDPGGKMTKAFARGTWETFDVGIVPNKDPDPLNTWPIRASPPIAQHIMSCFDAYPEIESKQEAIQKAFVVHHVAKEIKITKKAADELLAEVKNLTHVG